MGVFDEIGKLTPDNITNYNKDGWEPFIKNANVADETLKKFLNDANQTDKSLAAFKQYPDVVNKTGKAFDFAALGAKAFTVAINAGIMLLVVKSIELVTNALGDYINRNELAIEAATKANENIKSINDSFTEHKKLIDDYASSYDSLSKGIDKSTNKNLNLDTEDYEKYLDINKQFAEAFPSLITGFDDQGNAILSIGTNSTSSTTELEKLLDSEKELANYKIAQNIDDAFKGVVARAEEATKETANFNQSLEETNDSIKNMSDLSASIQSFNKDDSFFRIDATKDGAKEYAKAMQDALKEIGAYNPDTGIQYGPQDSTGADTEYMFNLYSLTDEQLSQLKDRMKEQTNDLNMAFADSVGTSEVGIKEQQQNLELAWKDFIPSLMATSQNSASYKELGEQMQSAVDSMISNLDVDQFQVINKDYSGDVQSYIREQIIKPIYYAEPAVKSAYAKLFSLDPSTFTDFDTYEDQVNSLVEKIVGGDEDKQIEFKVKFGLDNLDSQKEKLQNELNQNPIQMNVQLSKQDVIANINSLSDGFESLDKIMNSISGDNPFDYALLDDDKFTKIFSALDDGGKAYENFIDTVSNSPKDIKSTQSAFDNLVTTWIDSSGVLNGLTEDNANLATAMLQNMGVANAEEVVTSRLAIAQEHLAAQKAYTAEVSNKLANATANEIPAILDEATNSDIAKVALAGLVLEKQFFNGNSLNTSGDIENILSLVGVIGTANKALQALNAVKSGKVGAGSKADYDSIVSAAQKEAEDAIAAATNYKGKGSAVNTIYSGGVDTNKTSGSGKDKSNTTQEIDWIERGTKVLQDEYAKLEELANKDTIAYLGLTQEEFDNAKSIFDNGLGNTIDGLSQLQAYADKAGLSLGELYTMIQSGAPSASKENALQSMLKMQTETLLPQYQREVEAYSKSYEDALKAIPSEYKDKIEHGGVDIESLPSDLGKKVQAAMDDYEKLKSSEKQLADGETEHIETITKLYDNRINKIDIENEKLEQSNKIVKSQIELMEARGEIVGADFYERQIKNNKGLISGNQQDIAEWESEMADLRKANVSTDSKVYKELQAKVKSARNEIYGLKLEQEELNKTLEQMPIDNLNTLISMYKDISATIENWGAVYSATGQKLNADYFQTLISNGATTIDQYKELASEIENVMDDQEEGSTRWNELYEQLQSVNSEMSSMVQNLKKWNEELLKMPLDNISNYSSELQKVADGLSNVKSEYDTVVSAVTGAIKDQIDAINEQKDAVNDEYDAQKKALQDKLDLLNKQNKELQLQQKYEQALYNLQKANQQATEKVIRDGQVVYEQNADTLREAQEAVQDAKFDMETNQIQTQIDDLQETLDGLNEKYQDQIDSLQKISDKWSEISDKITQAQNEAKASEILGPGWKDKVLSGNDTALFNTFSGMYANTAEQLKKYQDQIDSTNNIQSLLEDYVNSYKEGTITYDEALKGINGLLSQLNKTMSASGNLQNIFDYLGTVNDTASNADAVLVGIQSGLKDTATELLKSLEQYNKNSGMISEYTSSWQQLTDNVASMLDVLREVRDNLENASNEDEDDDDDDDKTSSNGWGTGDVNNGPGVSRKDGITRGLIGSSSESDREASMKLLGLKKLDPDEIPAVLHMGEAVFNSDQQQKLLENFGTAWNYKPSVPDYSSLLSNVNVTNKTETPMITLNGGINIQKSDTPDELAKGIMDGKLGLALGQRLGKR